MKQYEISCNNRVDTIDIIKGFGILLVIWGHISTGGQFSRYFVYAFHMPLFFFFSGVVSKPSGNLKIEFKKTFRSLYVPFAFFTFCDVLVFITKSCFNNDLNIINLIKYSIRLLTGLSTPYLNAPIWFLFSLFTIKILFYLIHHIRYSKFLLLIVFALCMGYSFLLDKLSIPYSLFLPTIISFPFFYFGVFL